MIIKTLFIGIGSLCAGLTMAVSQADLVVPAEAMPPSAQQVQRSTEAVMETRTVQMTPIPAEAVAADQRNRIETLIRQVLGHAANVVMTDALPPATPPLEGQAEPVDTVNPRYTVNVRIAAAKSGGWFSGEQWPVTLEVIDSQGKTLGSQEIPYQPGSETAFSNATREFLTKHLGLVTDQKPSGSPQPRLRVWLETQDNRPVHLNSQIAFYFQASQKGYVSLYHFASSGAVQRIYPIPQQPYNFVEAERIYRFPQTGYLQLKGPPGEETVKAVFTVLPSNTPRQQAGGLTYKSDPLVVIPTHYPVLFATGDMTRFFALPRHLYTETHLSYTLKDQ